MFTGIIEEIGIISSVVRNAKSLRLSVYAKKVLDDLKLGDSISVNGVCLTVSELGRNHFVVDVVEETLARSAFIKNRIGDKVNLERALLLTSRLGGHIMTGHIDCVAEIKGKIAKSSSFELILSIPKDYLKYIIQKGSIGVDGVSLTVVKLSADGAHAAIVPHTAQSTTLGQKNVGDKINVEVDVLPKYLESLFQLEPQSQSEKMMLTSGFMPLGVWEN
ncbi:MAG: riboflavin synthase [Candidatus Saganbacteria bacterium]|uniref:Riboflavin synthase n=1 Tax=Candidatus Saganbacteria bacterium TaxID=2575572 RepID=A0A833L075_UNCSA|nr:MAG: riboflavin synthase [Candidatus Saganbacteria bacterium]